MSRKNVLIALGVILVAGAVVGANFYFKRDKGLTVTTDVIKTRDLDAIANFLDLRMVCPMNLDQLAFFHQ